MDSDAKPKLVFFRGRREQLPFYIRLHLQDRVNCLSQFFDVTVIDYDCDYRAICDRYLPEIALFESGVFAGSKHITNTSAHPEIPKLGFCDTDAYCESRELFISDMARLGVDTFFSHSVSLAEYTPDIADRLFVCPNFADPAVFHDYGAPKTIPALLTGSLIAHYPWRHRIGKIISRYYPTLTCPHFGWSDEANTFRMISGEQYARMINASWVVPTCGTIAKELVRKHFEIPAAKACLVTEKTAGTEAAGFIDGYNCIYADEEDVLDKLDHLFQHQDELAQISSAGYELVHSRHTMKQRDEVFQWFKLRKTLKPSEKIVQTGPFEPLIVVDRHSPINNRHLIGNGTDRILLRMGNEHLHAGRYDEAEALYLQCLNYHPFVPEPKLRLAHCSLYKGDAARALQWVTQTLNRVLGMYGAAEPDPVEWSCLIIALLCQGRLVEGRRRAHQFPLLQHPELDRIRMVVDALDHPGGQVRWPVRGGEARYSVHRLPELSFRQWAQNLSTMLRASHQYHWAEAVYQMGRSGIRPSDSHGSPPSKLKGRAPNNSAGTVGGDFDALDTTSYHHLTLPLRSECYLSVIRERLQRFVSPLIRGPLHELEAVFGDFLPYRFSRRKSDEFFHAIQQLMQQEAVQTGLVIGASAGRGSTDAFVEGARENSNKPTVFCVNQGAELCNLQNRYANCAFVRSISALDELERDRTAILDVVLIANGHCLNTEVLTRIYGTRFIVLDDINTYANHGFHKRLLEDRNYRLRSYNPAHRNGYAIFERDIRSSAVSQQDERTLESKIF